MKPLPDLKPKVYIVAAMIAVLAPFITYSIGKTRALDEAVVASIVTTKKNADTEYQKIMADISKNKQRLSLLDGYSEKIKKITSDIATNETENKRLSADIRSKTAELAALNKDVTVAKSRPIVLPAGEFTVGQDINSGRYTVTGSSNFVVHGVSGRLKVNTILGGDYGVDSYTCNLEDGDQIRTGSSAYFYP